MSNSVSLVSAEISTISCFFIKPSVNLQSKLNYATFLTYTLLYMSTNLTTRLNKTGKSLLLLILNLKTRFKSFSLCYLPLPEFLTDASIRICHHFIKGTLNIATLKLTPTLKCIINVKHQWNLIVKTCLRWREKRLWKEGTTERLWFFDECYIQFIVSRYLAKPTYFAD